MPIPCVDVLVWDGGFVLLLKRAKSPAENSWWLPGGRVLHSESRQDAARRKVREECSLEVSEVTEVASFDVFLPHAEG